DVIKTMKDSDVPKFEIQNGILVYIKDKCTANEIKWLTDVGVKEKSNIPIYSYDKPIIPIGFTYKEGTWDTGYVIVDSKDNEFVWVPIDGTNVKYEKNLTYPGAQINILDDKLPVGVSNEQEQIINYGGFYIARYEAGKETSDVLVSKKGRNVWNNINYTDSKIKAEAMYTTVEVKSGLVTGTMWDSIMKWISNSSKSVLDSTSWGNYINSVAPANVVGCRSLQTTGFTEEWKIKNIYDIAGNAWEWTNEICNTYRINRGGVYGASGLDYPASSRADNDVPCSYDGLSYRIALYIK
ncbi:MAG: hypothetical protein RR144_06190, partial [Clostridia bacterium]